MNITENQLFDYIKCPAYYDMKYNKKISTPEQPSMAKLLNKVSNYFYTNLLDRKICSMDQLKKKWDSICKNHDEYMNGRRCIEGINYIINYAKWTSNNRVTLIDFESDYKINVDTITLQGSIGPVAALPGKKCELIVPRFSNREPEQNAIDKNLKYTMDCYAFLRAYNHPIDAVRIVHHKNNKEFTTNRSQQDYDRLISTIKGVANGIRSESFYPRENSFCSVCELKLYCKYWS